MEKILLAVDAQKIDTGTLDFACFLGKLTGSSITGAFLENLVANEKPVLKKMYGGSFLDWQVNEQDPAYIKKMKNISDNIEFFKQACANRSVDCAVQKFEGNPLREIIDESRYVDLLIIDSETSFKKNYEGAPTDFANYVLRNSECPVIVAPESFDAIDTIVFAYDGSWTSFFAIKQFTYLFPQFMTKKIHVVHVNKNIPWGATDRDRVKEWLKAHYKFFEFEILEGDAETRLLPYLFMKKNTFIVMGAYGRSVLSQHFKRSHAKLLIKAVTQPIFIAHS
jgi:nucleotide-binding universal stress UspA family protein